MVPRLPELSRIRTRVRGADVSVDRYDVSVERYGQARIQLL